MLSKKHSHWQNFYTIFLRDQTQMQKYTSVQGQYETCKIFCCRSLLLSDCASTISCSQPVQYNTQYLVLRYPVQFGRIVNMAMFFFSKYVEYSCTEWNNLHVYKINQAIMLIFSLKICTRRSK